MCHARRSEAWSTIARRAACVVCRRCRGDREHRPVHGRSAARQSRSAGDRPRRCRRRLDRYERGDRARRRHRNDTRCERDHRRRSCGGVDARAVTAHTRQRCRGAQGRVEPHGRVHAEVADGRNGRSGRLRQHRPPRCPTTGRLRRRTARRRPGDGRVGGAARSRARRAVVTCRHRFAALPTDPGDSPPHRRRGAAADAVRTPSWSTPHGARWSTRGRCSAPCAME